MSEKSILEQALLQVQTLEEAVKQNAKGILASTMKQELNDLLKESLEEEEEVEASEEEETEVAEQPDPEEEDEDDMSSETSDTDDEDENLDNLDNEDPMKNVDDESDEFGDESEDESDEFGDESDEFGDESDDMPSDMSGDDVLDMTGASDDEVLKVFKAMKPEDGVVVKKDGNEIDIDLGDDEFIIKLDEEGDESEMSEGDVMPDMDTNEEFGMEDENVYEVEIDEEEVEEEEEETHKIEATEAARTKSNPHGNKNGMNRAGLPSKKKYKAGSGVFGINEEVEKLKKQNSEYKKALVLFKDKLNEVAVFNASLAYATRLFTEHSTTKQEKLNILKRFDSVSNMNESKGLYNTIKSELVTKKPVTESVVEKISNTPSTSASQQVLAESKAYENPQFKRMKDLMSKLK
jgi:hypothetical protein